MIELEVDLSASHNVKYDAVADLAIYMSSYPCLIINICPLPFSNISILVNFQAQVYPVQFCSDVERTQGCQNNIVACSSQTVDFSEFEFPCSSRDCRALYQLQLSTTVCEAGEVNVNHTSAWKLDVLQDKYIDAKREN